MVSSLVGQLYCSGFVTGGRASLQNTSLCAMVAHTAAVLTCDTLVSGVWCSTVSFGISPWVVLCSDCKVVAVNCKEAGVFLLTGWYSESVAYHLPRMNPQVLLRVAMPCPQCLPWTL